MALRYKIDILSALKNKGYSSFRLRKTALLSESTIQKLRENSNQSLSWANIDTLCRLLECQPGDLISYYPDDDNEKS